MYKYENHAALFSDTVTRLKQTNKLFLPSFFNQNIFVIFFSPLGEKKVSKTNFRLVCTRCNYIRRPQSIQNLGEVGRN